MRTFGRRREKAWRQLAARVGGEFVDGGCYLEDEVIVRRPTGTITLKYRFDDSESTQMFARCPAFLRFRIKSRHRLLRFWLALVMRQEWEQRSDLDRRFVIKGQDEAVARTLLATPTIRTLIDRQPYVNIRAQDGHLRFEQYGSVHDVDRLESLFDSFDALLRELATC